MARVAPTPSDVPRGEVEGSGTLGIEHLCRCDHLTDVIVLSDSAAKEDSAKVDIERDVAASQVMEGHLEIPLQDLDGHRCLLLGDTWEALQP
jgi:hypothetical protein